MSSIGGYQEEGAETTKVTPLNHGCPSEKCASAKVQEAWLASKKAQFETERREENLRVLCKVLTT